MFDYLGNYFNQEKLRIAFTFQSKYLGMSPWDCPGLFIILPFLEHQFGIYHVEGGLNKISEAIRYRDKISNLDPWNAANYLALGKDYKAQGDLIKTKEMLDKILSFASGKQVADQAKIDLAP